MKICVLFTGGTIGSASKDGVISPDKSNRFKLIDMYCEQFRGDVTWDCKEIYQILSENLDGKHMTELVGAVNEAVESHCYDGIIVTHGTDTLQCSAAMLEYVFSDVGIPIILVSSDYCLEDERANGLINFNYAVKYIEGGNRAGVYVSYCNKGGKPMIHRGSCLQNPISYSADVQSIQGELVGTFEGDTFIPNEKVDWTRIDSRLEQVRINCLYGLNKSNIDFSEAEGKIAAIRALPGMRYPLLDKQVKAVIIEAYHSGTICVDKRLEDFIEDAGELDIPVYLVGLADTGEEYETVEEYRRLGVVPAVGEGFISLYCRCWLKIACDNKKNN